jgi:hypothetical protein
MSSPKIDPTRVSKRFMNHLNAGLIFFLLLASPESFGATNFQTAEKCGANIDQSPQKTLADSDGSGTWHEYDKTTDIPPLAGGAAAFAWVDVASKQYMLLQETAEDGNSFTGYCFDPTGKLWRLRYELRTAWGWGFREEGLIVNRKLQVETSDFFNTSNEKPIPKPGLAQDVSEALKPHLYMAKSELPFSKLLVERTPNHDAQKTERGSRKTKG